MTQNVLRDDRNATNNAARRLYDEEGDNGRAAAFTALGAMGQFIMLFQVPLAEHLQMPILNLQNALVALEENNVLPILKPVARSGRAASSHSHLTLKGTAAGTVKRLLQAGLDRKRALEVVAKALTEQGVRPERGSGTITGNTVRHWCDEVAEDVGRRGTAAMAYDSMFTAQEIERFYAYPSNQTREDFALASLADFVRQIFPRYGE